MSHFTELECEFDQSQEAAFVKALENKFGEGHVEVHETGKGKGLMGYQGDDRSEQEKNNPNYAPKCEIIIRRKYVGKMSNDIGYRRLPNGKYAGYVSDYDQGRFGVEEQGKIAQFYSSYVHERLLKAKGWNSITKTVDAKGVITLKAKKY